MAHGSGGRERHCWQLGAAAPNPGPSALPANSGDPLRPSQSHPTVLVVRTLSTATAVHCSRHLGLLALAPPTCSCRAAHSGTITVNTAVGATGSPRAPAAARHLPHALKEATWQWCTRPAPNRVPHDRPGPPYKCTSLFPCSHSTLPHRPPSITSAGGSFPPAPILCISIHQHCPPAATPPSGTHPRPAPVHHDQAAAAAAAGHGPHGCISHQVSAG